MSRESQTISQKQKKSALFKTSVAVTMLGLFGASETHAAIVTPAGLQPGDKFNLVFVSTTTTTATSSDPVYYDNLLQTEANNAGLGSYGGQPVSWNLLGSFEYQLTPTSYTGIYANTRFHPASPIYRLDGVKVANNADFAANNTSTADLWDGTLQNPININSQGNVQNSFVWTGTDASGYTGAKTGAWAIRDYLADNPGFETDVQYGYSGSTNYQWTDFSDNSPATNGHLPAGAHSFALYAFSNELTVPVPEPTSCLMALGAAIGIGLAAAKMKNTKNTCEEV